MANKHELDAWWRVENLEKTEEHIRLKRQLQEFDLLNDFKRKNSM
jgi:hypothetical protein